MQLTFLGTSAGSPTLDRNVTGLTLSFRRRPGLWLFDCGDGAQRRLMRAGLSLLKIDRIFITHLHGDHCYGLFGILASRGLLQDCEDRPVTIYGPRGIAEMVRVVLELSRVKLAYEVDFVEYNTGMIVEEAGIQVEAVKLAHDVISHAFVITEADRPGPFDAAAAKAAGVPSGPLFGRLSQGESITLPDGRIIDGKTFVGPTRPGRRIIIGGDNDKPELLSESLQGACLFIHEATHTEEVSAGLKRKLRHSTALAVANTAAAANLPTLCLTHFSPRFVDNERKNGRPLKEIEDEARSVYKGQLILARDLMRLSIDDDGRVTEEPRSK